MTTIRLPDWSTVPRLGVVVPPEGTPGWTDAAWWAVLLEAWGYPADHFSDAAQASDRGTTTLIVAAAAIDDPAASILERALACGTSLLLVGRPSAAAARVLGLTIGSREAGGRLHVDEPDLLVAAGACVPAPGDDGCVVLDQPGPVGELGPDWTVFASWIGGGAPAVAVRPVAGVASRTTLAWFGLPVDALDHRATEVAVLLAEATLDRAAPAGLVGLGRWPGGRPAALVVDGDVDHPTGVDPECSRYVAPALETAARAGYPAYGIYVAGANVDAEPGSFPPAEYYNHSQTHPYSHWNARPWESLGADEMTAEVRRCADAFVRHLGRGDGGMFRLPHFQLEAAERTYEVLDRLGYRAESSVGANVAITGGLPYHPARRPWSERPADLAWARSHPDPAGRFGLLQLPLSSDPVAPEFANGFCSYNTLGEGVRGRTAAPEAYELVLDEVVERAVARRGLGHVFIDPPDAGYGRLAGDRIDYASAVERWLGRCVARDDLAILTTAGLADWWSAREAALGRIATRLEAGELVVELADPPPGTTLAVLEPAGGGGSRRRRRIRLEAGPVGRAAGGGAK